MEVVTRLIQVDLTDLRLAVTLLATALMNVRMTWSLHLGRVPGADTFVDVVCLSIAFPTLQGFWLRHVLNLRTLPTGARTIERG